MAARDDGDSFGRCGIDSVMLPDAESTVGMRHARKFNGIEFHLSDVWMLTRLDLKIPPLARHTLLCRGRQRSGALPDRTGANEFTRCNEERHWAVKAANDDGVRMLLDAGRIERCLM